MSMIIKSKLYFSYIITAITQNDMLFDATLRRVEASTDYKTQSSLKTIRIDDKYQDLFFTQFKDGMPIMLSFDDNNKVISVLAIKDFTV